MVADRAGDRVRKCVWPLGFVFPNILANSNPTITRLLVEVDNQGVSSNTRGIEKTADRVL